MIRPFLLISLLIPCIANASGRFANFYVIEKSLYNSSMTIEKLNKAAKLVIDCRLPGTRRVGCEIDQVVNETIKVNIKFFLPPDYEQICSISEKLNNNEWHQIFYEDLKNKDNPLNISNGSHICIFKTGM